MHNVLHTNSLWAATPSDSSVYESVFEIALVRLSETSDYLLGQVNIPLAVIRRTSGNLQKYFIFHYHFIIMHNAKTQRISRSKTANDRDATWCRKNNTASIFSARSVICWIVIVHTLVHLLWLYIIDDEGVIY